MYFERQQHTCIPSHQHNCQQTNQRSHIHHQQRGVVCETNKNIVSDFQFKSGVSGVGTIYSDRNGWQSDIKSKESKMTTQMNYRVQKIKILCQWLLMYWCVDMLKDVSTMCWCDDVEENKFLDFKKTAFGQNENFCFWNSFWSGKKKLFVENKQHLRFSKTFVWGGGGGSAKLTKVGFDWEFGCPVAQAISHTPISALRFSLLTESWFPHFTHYTRSFW